MPQLPDHENDFLAPGPTYIAPGSGFLFGDVGNKRSLINFLPAKVAADLLIRNYFENVHFIARVVHWPSFQLHYDNFWTSVLAGLEPPAWQQSIVLSVMFSAVASMPEQEVSAIFARPKSTIVGNFQAGTEIALSKAQFLRATKLETLQALVIYLTPMCRDQLSRAHSVLVGMAVRLAECMGLHRDPEDVYGLSAVDCHVRRIIWFQLCFLDFRTCESQGPRPGVKRDDYDTKFPLNINDADLLLARPQESKSKWTDMTVSRIRFECTEMQRVVWFDRIRIAKKRASLTHILGKIESFRKAMEAKYAPILNPEIPIQKYAQLLMNLMIQRLYVMVLHLYLNNASNRVPERLAQLTIHSGIQSMESAVAMEQLPDLSRWKWYSGAYQQWHIAFLLLTVIYQTPTLPEADRIWDVIDFVFEPDPFLSRAQKARAIITAIKDRTAVYRDLRRIRIPVSMKDGLDARRPSSVDIGGSKTQGESTDCVPPPDTTTSSGINAMASDKKHTTDQSWSFDTPATLYLESKYLPRRPSGAFTQYVSSQFQSSSSSSRPLPPPPQQQQPPPAQQQQTPPRSDVNQTSPGQQIDLNSPSDSGTNESWPPLITTDQVSWRTALGAATTTSPPHSAMQSFAGAAAKQPLPGSGSPFGIGSGFPGDQINIPQLQQTSGRGDSIMLDIDWVSLNLSTLCLGLVANPSVVASGRVG